MSKYEINVPPTMIDPDGTKYVGEFNKSTGGVSSWNDLTDKPFGEEFENVFTWSGTATKNGNQVEANLTMDRSAFSTSSEYALIVNGVVVPADYSQVYTYIHEFNSSGKTNSDGDYCKIHIENSNASLTFRSHEWSSEDDVPESFDIELTVAKVVRKPLSSEYLPEILFKNYSMMAYKGPDGWELGDGTTSEADEAYRRGQTVVLFIPDYGYVIPTYIDSGQIKATGIRYDVAKDTFMILHLDIVDNFDGTFKVTGVEKTLTTS